MPPTSGLLAPQVAQDSPAARIGLRGGGTTKSRIGNARLILGGDIILQVMDIPMYPDIDTYQRIRGRLSSARIGRTGHTKSIKDWQDHRAEEYRTLSNPWAPIVVMARLDKANQEGRCRFVLRDCRR